MQADQAVSLRPGGGRGQSRGVLIHRFEQIPRSGGLADSSFSSGGDRSAFPTHYNPPPKAISDSLQDITAAKSDIEAELLVEDPDCTKQIITPVQALPQIGKHANIDSNNWRGRTPPPSFPALDERGKEQPKEFAPRRLDNDWRDREHDHNHNHSHNHNYNHTHTHTHIHSHSSSPGYQSRIQETLDRSQQSRRQDPLDRLQHSRQQEPLDRLIHSRQQDPLDRLQHSRQQDPFDRLQHSRQQDPPPHSTGIDVRSVQAIVKAANPWSARRGVLSEKDKVLRKVKGILNKLTPEKFNVLVEQLLDSGIISAEILQGVISLIFDKAVLEPTFCPMYAEMCVHLSKTLPEFPSNNPDVKPIAFRWILLNICQEEFEGANNMRAEIKQMTKPEQELARLEKEKLVKIRTLGNIRLIGELFKQKMIPEKIVIRCVAELLGSDFKATPAEENIEALCHLLTTVGKQLEESPKSRANYDSYFVWLKEMSTNSHLPSRIRFMIQDIIDLRQNKWVPRREQVKAKTITEIHQEAEQKMGLRPGMVGGHRNNERGGPAMMALVGPNFRYPPPGSMMPGTPGLIPGLGKLPTSSGFMPPYMPGMNGDGWETNTMGRNNIKKGGEGHHIPPPMQIGGERFLPQNNFNVPLFGGSSNSSSLVRGVSRPLQHNVQPQYPPSFGAPHHSHAPFSERDRFEQMRVEQWRGEALRFEQMSIQNNNSNTRSAHVLRTGPPLDLTQKADSLLKEYLSVGDLEEAILCVKELRSPGFHPQFVYIAVDMVLEKQDRERALIAKLIESLCSRGVLSHRDIKSGIGSFAEHLMDISIDIRMAPIHIGELVGSLLVRGFADLSLLKDMMEKIEQIGLRKRLFDSAITVVQYSPNPDRVLSHRAELFELERLIR